VFTELTRISMLTNENKLNLPDSIPSFYVPELPKPPAQIQPAQQSTNFYNLKLSGTLRGLGGTLRGLGAIMGISQKAAVSEIFRNPPAQQSTPAAEPQVKPEPTQSKPAPVSKEQIAKDQAAKERAELIPPSAHKPKPPEDTKPTKPGDKRKIVDAASAHEAARQALEALHKRGEIIERTRDGSERLENDAKDFLENVKKLTEKYK